jgi:hypothetical protein
MDHKGISVSILNEKFLQPPYLIFQEILNNDESDLSSVHMVKLNTSAPLCLGRALRNDIRINDITLSRYHSNLKVTKYGLFLQDFKSKFGSLVMLKKPFEISKSNNNQVFQIGRAFMKTEVNANWKLYIEPDYIKNPRKFTLKNYKEQFNWVNHEPYS